MVLEQNINIINPSIVKTNVTNKKKWGQKERGGRRGNGVKFHKEVNRYYAKLKYNLEMINTLTLPQCLLQGELVTFGVAMSLIFGLSGAL